MQPPRAVIDLSKAPGRREAWDRPTWFICLWAVCEVIFVRNSLQPSSRLRSAILRRFGASIGEGVIMRPGLRVKFPWKLEIADRSWIGEDVWIHNQDQLVIGADVVISQGTFITTGTHAFRTDMALITRPVHVADGAWVTSRCILLAGTRIGRSAVILPNTVVRGEVPEQAVYGTPSGTVVGSRFSTPSSGI